MKSVGYYACRLLYRGRGWKAVTMPVVCCTEGVDGKRWLLSLSSVVQRAWMESVGYQYEVRLPVQLRITAQGFDVSLERSPPIMLLFLLSWSAEMTTVSRGTRLNCLSPFFPISFLFPTLSLTKLTTVDAGWHDTG